jgi:hypothetical protein
MMSTYSKTNRSTTAFPCNIVRRFSAIITKIVNRPDGKTLSMVKKPQATSHPGADYVEFDMCHNSLSAYHL